VIGSRAWRRQWFGEMLSTQVFSSRPTRDWHWRSRNQCLMRAGHLPIVNSVSIVSRPNA